MSNEHQNTGGTDTGNHARGRIAVLGDGGWGTAMACLLAGRGLQVTIWGHDPQYLDEMRRTRRNRRFLPAVSLPGNVTLEADMERAVTGADMIFVAVPTKFLRAVLQGRRLPRQTPVVSLTKGIEPHSLLRPSQLLRQLCGCDRVAVLSGPSHAEEVARGLPASVTVASAAPETAAAVQALLMGPSFRVYTSTDPVGVELGGALKNVVALAAGICAGLELGDNAMAALLTRGLAEITRLGTALGARPETFAGLAGLGDLVVTCVSRHGRNRAVGAELGRGRQLAQIMAERPTVAEGVTTARSALALARRTGVVMPIVEQVVAVIESGKSPALAARELMQREGRDEAD